MVKSCLTVLSALYALASASNQHILSHEQAQAGILRRFNVSGEERNTVLQIAQNQDLDVWHVGRSFIDVYTSSEAAGLPDDLHKLAHTTSYIPQFNFQRQDVQSLTRSWNLTVLNNSTFHEGYHPLPEIKKFLKKLVALHPDIVSLTRIGISGEGRDIAALTISKPGPIHDVEGARKKKKKKAPRPGEKFDFVVLGAQHAREWIATATSLYLAHALTINSTHEEPHSLSSLLDVYNFHIIPVPNPDGYTYTWKKDRYWYKNRQIVAPHSKCEGLDMNRNWGFKWQPEPVGPEPAEPVDPCSHWYPGSRPFESPEVNSIANFISTLHNPISFIDLRSYGQMVSAPYSYSCDIIPKDGEDQAEAAYGAVHAIKDVHAAHFEEGRLCETLYEAPGNVIDWMYQRAGIKYSYVVHLRDTGTFGFSLPEKWIRPVGEETASMIRYLAKFIDGRVKR